MLESEKFYYTVLGWRVSESSFTDSNWYDGSIATLRKHFKPKHSVMMQRYRLRQLAQLPGESATHFLASLAELASLCKFGDLQDEMIHDQIIEKTSIPRIREWLLMETDSLSLERAMKLAVRGNQLQLPNQPPKVQQVRRKPVPSCREKKFSPSANTKGFTAMQCKNCGSSSHNKHSQNCPARGAQCRSCGKMNHFAK